MMKKSILLAAIITMSAIPAFADISALTAKFGGGCTSSNTTGTCTIKVSATGSSLDGETVLLKYAADSKSTFKKVSSRARDISSGSTSFKIKNKDGCYLAITGNNGNDKPDVSSRKICEK